MCVLCTGIATLVCADPVIVRRPTSAVKELGTSVQFDCSISESYQYYFLWRRHRQASDAADADRQLIYYTNNNTGFVRGPGFPAERFHRVGNYGLSITSLTLQDGASYRCEFIFNSLTASANLFVIGKFFA